MSGHTPGPWYFGSMYGWGGVCITRKPADTYGPAGTIGDAPIAKVIDKAPHWENSYPVESNARLIAASPDLLTALSAFIEAAEDDGEPLPGTRFYAGYVAGKAALAKALGESA